MIQCAECEHFRSDEKGVARFTCNPLINIKEPECILKWQLFKQENLVQRVDSFQLKLEVINQRVESLVQAYQAMQRIYQRIAPMQEKMFRHVEREIDEMDDAERWKRGCDDEDDNDNPREPY
jgi:E3 ubiquitin-protein ligase DOA10